MKHINHKNQYTENEYTTESNLESMDSLSSHQIFQRLQKKKPTKQKKNNTTICRETQKPRIPKQSSERRIETKESTGLPSDYTTKLQSSGWYGTGTKTDI